MTEKQFESVNIDDELSYIVIDGVQCYVDTGDDIIIVNKLNELTNEIKQLKKQIKRDKLNEAIQTIDKMITTPEQYGAWSIIYEKLIGKPLSYRLKR